MKSAMERCKRFLLYFFCILTGSFFMGVISSFICEFFFDMPPEMVFWTISLVGLLGGLAYWIAVSSLERR